MYNYGGDSLQGRYFLHHLHPFTLSEALGFPIDESPDECLQLSKHIPKETQKTLTSLLQLGGFPEPFLGASAKEAARWRLGYGERLVREEIRDLENIRDLDRLELLFERLPQVVGSPLSINSLREDLEVAFETVRKWVSVFDSTYATFRLPPWGAPKIRAVKKEQKLYLWDWARVPSLPARLENLVAAHLYRFCDFMKDIHGEKTELRYFRDVLGHEVDFIVTRSGKPWFAVEVKTSFEPLDKGLRHLLERVHVPQAFQISLNGDKDVVVPKINGCEVRMLSASHFLAHLP